MKKPLVYFLAAVTTAYIGSASTNVSAIFDWNDVTFSIQDQDEAPEVVVVPETTDDGKVINEVYLEDDPGIKKVVLPDTVNEVEVIRCTGITEFSVSENNPYKKAYELSVNETEIALEEGQTYKLNVSLDNRFFYNESLVITSDHGDIAQVSKDGTITAVSAGKAVITAKAKLRDPDDPADNVRYVSVTVNVAPPKTLTAEQVSALESLKNKGSITIGSFGRQEMIIRGEIASDTPRITYDEVTDIIESSEFKKYEDIVGRINKIHGAADYYGGSGTTKVEYWFDDKGNKKIRLYPDFAEPKIVFNRCDENGMAVYTEELYPEKRELSVDGGVRDFVYFIYNDVKDKPVKADTGDIDGSGKIDVTDLTELSLYLLGDRELTENQQKSADVDSDGAVTLADLARLQQYLSKKITSF